MPRLVRSLALLVACSLGACQGTGDVKKSASTSSDATSNPVQDVFNATDTPSTVDAGSTSTADSWPTWPDVEDLDVPPCEASTPVVPKPPDDLIPHTLPMAAFSDVTAQYGIPLTSHAYCAVGADFDADGREDILLVEISPGKAKIHVILLAKGKTQHRYTEVDTSLLLPDNGCSAVDLDFDGRLDLLLAGTSGLAFYRNLGDGTFVDKSEAYLPYDMDFDA